MAWRAELTLREEQAATGRQRAWRLLLETALVEVAVEKAVEAVEAMEQEEAATQQEEAATARRCLISGVPPAISMAASSSLIATQAALK